MKKKVYVAGKLNDMAVGYLLNVHKMMDTAEEVRKAGYSIFVPAIDLLMGIKFGYKDYHDYFDNSMPWLLASDAIMLTPGFETSKGTIREIEAALDAEIPVFLSVKDMDDYFIGGRDNSVKAIVHIDDNKIEQVITKALHEVKDGSSRK